MAREKICGVYKITSPSGGFYIGSSVDIYARWQGHKSGFRNNNHENNTLSRACNKYGADKLLFEIVEECSRERVRNIEQRYIDELNPEYNQSRCVKESLTELWEDKDFRAAGVEKTRNQAKEWRKDPVWVKKQKDGAGAALAKLHLDPEFKKAHAKRAIDKLKIINSSPEIRAKQIKSMRLKIDIDKKNPEVWDKRNAKIRALLCSKVLCVETGVIFNSHKDAGEWLRSKFGYKTSGHISNALAGRVKVAYGFHWSRVGV